MAVLWKNNRPMVASEIIGSSANRTWKDRSIYVILNTLIDKGAVALSNQRVTAINNNSKAYLPVITSEEYVVSNIASIEESGIIMNFDSVVKGILNLKKG